MERVTGLRHNAGRTETATIDPMARIVSSFASPSKDGNPADHCPLQEAIHSMRYLPAIALVFSFGVFVHAGEWPQLPEQDAVLEIPAQEWPRRPGPRTVQIRICYPGGTRAGMNGNTGILLTLHNWGGSDCDGTASPVIVAKELNVVAVCVNYLQSGRHDAIEAVEAYDFGYLQALDAIRGLWFVRDGLQRQGVRFDDRRLYCVGGSGGGNVTLMANKLAPLTFACVIDLCGMTRLSDDIAYGLPGGSELNARWSRDAASPDFLSLDDQELRWVANPVHLQEMNRLGSQSLVMVVHGTDDDVCPFADAVDLVDRLKAAGLNVQPEFVDASRVDGRTFTGTGHSPGDRTGIVLFLASGMSVGGQAKPAVPDTEGGRSAHSGLPVRIGQQTDFDLRHTVKYRTSAGAFLISYANGYPEGRFERRATPPEYDNHDDLMCWRDAAGQRQAVQTESDWEIRREHIRAHLERVMGVLPSPLHQVVPDVRIVEERTLRPPHVSRPILRRKITFQSTSKTRVPAWVLIPLNSGLPELDDELVREGRRPAVLCLHQTTEFGKDEPAGIRGDPSLKYALELAEQGFVTMAPDYPSFGEYQFDFATGDFPSGSLQAVQDNCTAISVLTRMPEVDGERIGCIGHSLGGHNAVLTAVFEPGIRAIVCSCGFSSLQEDDVPSWSGPRYMPRLATDFGNDANRVPFDFPELIAALAPRPFLACYALQDDDFAASGVQRVLRSAESVYRLVGAESCLDSFAVDAPHSFPADSRRRASQFLRLHLRADHADGSSQSVKLPPAR